MKSYAFIKLLLVHDHAGMREEVAALLRRVGEGVTVLHAPASHGALDLLAREADIAAVLLDLDPPGRNNTTTLAGVRAVRPELPVIVLSASERPDDVRATLGAGARGFIPRSTAPATLVAAVRLVLSGGTYVPAPLLLLDGPAAVPSRPDPALTGRQAEILRALSSGLPNKEIAARFRLSEKTVKAHVSAVFRALHVANRTQAAEAARRLHLLD